MKCAGTSLKTALEKQGILFNIIGSQIGLKKGLLKHNCVTPEAVQRASRMKGFDEAWKWTFVRNPWDRAVSNYFYMRKASYFDVTFKDYLKLPFNKMPNLAKAHGRSLCYYFGNTKIDFIGRYKNLQEDFDYVCEKIGIQTCKLPHENKTNHKHYTEYYDDECIELVANKFADDIERFGYKFT